MRNLFSRHPVSFMAFYLLFYLSAFRWLEVHIAVPDVLVQNHIFGNPKGFAFESIRSFVDCLLTGEEFHVSLEDAANTSLAILAIMESAEKRMPVDVELPY